MENLKKIFNEWGIPIIVALIIAWFINYFIFFQISVPTESMYPTIKPGDRIIVTRVYKPENLKRGDVVVFQSEELGETLVKRLIGLPNEEVEVDSSGVVSINGNKIDEPYVKPENMSNKTLQKVKVPEGQFLFMGDNRRNSNDSRYWKNKFIAKSQIKGKSQIVVYPFNRVGKLK